MPNLISGRKQVATPDQLVDSRYKFLDLSKAQPNLGLTPITGT